MVNADKTKSIKISPEDRIFFRTLRNNENMKTVKLSGFVKQPGVFTFVKGYKLTDVINLAGGLDDDADLRGIVFKRSNLQSKQVNVARKNNERDVKLLEGRIAAGYKQAETDQKIKLTMIEQLKEESASMGDKYNGQIALNIKSNDLSKISKIDNVELQDGDDIYIPRMANYVVVMGEVYNEQSFIYKKDTSVRKYIKEVGGYTPNANRFRLYKVGVNGRAKKVHMHTRVAAGDIIVVPRRISGNDWITPICQTLQGLASIFIMAFAINKW
jgi:protein involved in polysaccharide export with SLBB domain